MRRFILFACIAIGIAAYAVTSSAQQTTASKASGQNRFLSYQGLLEQHGVPVQDGEYTIQLTIYTDPNGQNSCWHGTYTVPVTNGVFSVMLGSGDYPLPEPSAMDVPLYLGVQVGSGMQLPLVPIGVSATAINVADGAITAKKMGTDYVGSISLNGQKISSRGGDVNFQAGNGLTAFVDPTTNTIYFNNSASSASGKPGDNALNTTITTASGGTSGKIPKFTGSATIENSALSDNGTTFTAGGNFSVTESSGNTSIGGSLSVSHGITTTNTGNNLGLSVAHGASIDGGLTVSNSGGIGLTINSGGLNISGGDIYANGKLYNNGNVAFPSATKIHTGQDVGYLLDINTNWPAPNSADGPTNVIHNTGVYWNGTCLVTDICGNASSATYADSSRTSHTSDIAGTAHFADSSRASHQSDIAHFADSARAAYQADIAVFAQFADSARAAHQADFADSARAAHQADFADSARAAHQADIATFADSARAAHQADIATFADSARAAHQADIATFADSARAAHQADIATFADSARAAHQADIATFADSARAAHQADFADSARAAHQADIAAFAQFADSARAAYQADIAHFADSARAAHQADFATFADSSRAAHQADIAHFADSARASNFADSAKAAYQATVFTGHLNGDVIGPMDTTFVRGIQGHLITNTIDCANNPAGTSSGPILQYDCNSDQLHWVKPPTTGSGLPNRSMILMCDSLNHSVGYWVDTVNNAAVNSDDQILCTILRLPDVASKPATIPYSDLTHDYCAEIVEVGNGYFIIRLAMTTGGLSSWEGAYVQYAVID